MRGLVTPDNRQNKASGAFYSSIIMRLKRRPTDEVPTAAVDGIHLYYNPQWVMSLEIGELVGIIIHVAMHIANLHPLRRKGRKNLRWNASCDLAINSLLRNAGIALPGGGMHAEHFKFVQNLTAEKYYDLLEDHEIPEALAMIGAVMPPNDMEQESVDESTMRQLESDWQVAINQSYAVAKTKGNLPGELERLIGDITNPKIDWRHELRDFVNASCKDDFSWQRPNRRFIGRDMYLPSLGGESLGTIVVAIDTSGSIRAKELNAFASEMQGIAEVASVSIDIIFHDSKVARVQHWEPSDGDLVLRPAGGGGTSHVPVFNYIKDEMEEPTCLVCFTDLYSSFPNDAPPYPVIWCSTTAMKEGPFGKTIFCEV